MKRFLIINPFGIGDVLFTTALVKAIKSAVPQAFIGYWCNERVRPILENNPHLDKIFALSRGDIKRIFQGSKIQGIKSFLSLVNQLKKGRFDVAFDFSLDHRYCLLAKLAGIKRRIGFNYKGRGRYLSDKIDIDGYSEKHVVEYYLRLLKFVDLAPGDAKSELFVSAQSKTKAEALLSSRGIAKEDLLIGIAPGGGASWGENADFKHWPSLRFAQVADKLIEDLNAKVLIIGDRQEKALAEAIAKAMKNKAIDLTAETTLEELAAVISKMNVLVTNDGGPLHMAVALGVKTVSMYGPVDDLVYGPYPSSGDHLVLSRKLSCRPCYKNFKFTGCSNNRRCLLDITLEDVYTTVRRLA